MFKHKSITTIYIFGLSILFAFMLLFVSLLIYEEYNDFERDANLIRKTYVDSSIKYNVSSKTYNIEEEIANKKAELKKRLIKLMMEILSLSVILFGFAAIWSWIVHYILTKQVKIFQDFFHSASKKHISIDANSIALVEFKNMVPYINNMVDDIHRRKLKLRNINATLKRTVEIKTEDLHKKNKLLEDISIHNISLVKSQDSFIKHSIHEINTPLAVMLANIDMHKIKFGSTKYINKIEAASKVISTIYDDLTYMVKKDRIEYTKEWIDIGLFLSSRIDFFLEISRGNMHEIKSNLSEDIWGFFNHIELQRIIDNNISNAIKYSKKYSDIIILLTEDENHIIIEFHTITKKIIEDTMKIFQPFHREDTSELGLGLGLEIVGLICERENIAINVNSNSINTVFSYKIIKKGIR